MSPTESTQAMQAMRATHVTGAMSCDQVQALSDAYAAGALTAQEHERVDRHLVGCAACRRHVAESVEVASTLPLALAAASSLRLPAGLRDRVLHAVEANAIDRPRRRDEPGRRTPGVVVRCRRSAALRTIAALAAALVLALPVGLGVQLGVALARERALRSELASLVGQQEVVLEVVDARQTVKRLLVPPEGGASSNAPYGKLYTRPDMPHVVAMAGRLPPLLPGYAYHLWVRYQRQDQLAGVLLVNQGFGLLVFDADRDGPVYEVAWITAQPLQPAGAALASTPSGTTILRWQQPPGS
ncbi:MAG: zf-HC2 domain-containing protein [Chloroflexi bacterium]|nr:zf-HC2 domain-containing protein [Chloroflexota bacterium]